MIETHNCTLMLSGFALSIEILTLCPGNATSGFIEIAILATDCAARSPPFSVFWAAREINA